MAKFRKKPVVIDAIQHEGDFGIIERWLQSLGYPSWQESDADEAAMWPNDDGSIIIPTLEGDHRCDVGDWIIRGVAGELYPCKSDIFAATYDPVED